MIAARALALGLALVALLPLEAQGQKSARIGRLSPLSGNFTLVTRFGDGRAARLPEIAAELVQQRVDLILVGSSEGALAAKRATSTIPIVIKLEFILNAKAAKALGLAIPPAVMARADRVVEK